MKKIRTLIADDSTVYRSQIKAALQTIADVEIAGVASNGRFAVERLTQTSVDLLILDLEMPEMDGLQTLTEMNKRGISCKVLVFSSASERGAKTTMEALRLGASDFIAKPDVSSSTSESEVAALQPSQKIKLALEPKIHALFPDVVSRNVIPEEPTHQKINHPKIIWDLLNPKIVVIGASTGGPAVLEKIFSEISTPSDCPIVIAQHMPPIFTAELASRLSGVSGIPACEASHGQTLEKNCIYIAPGDYHLRLQGTIEHTTVALDRGPLINWVRPAVDPLFSTAAEIFKNSCLAFVLTGMGSDGKMGAEIIKQNNGAVIIQDEESCTVFGMPGAVFSTGAYDRISSPSEIANLLREKIGTREKDSNGQWLRRI